MINFEPGCGLGVDYRDREHVYSKGRLLVTRPESVASSNQRPSCSMGNGYEGGILSRAA